MEAKRIRLFGAMFYSAMIIIVITLGMLGTIMFDLPSMESTLYEMAKASGNIFYTVTLIIGLLIFVSFFLMMGVIYHELGHAIAARHYGMERIFIRVYGLFAGICVSCKGDGVEDAISLSPTADAVVDFGGGVLAGAMFLLVYAFTQSWAILLLFGMLIQYSAEETFGYATCGLMVNNLRKKGRFSFTLMDELNEEDWNDIDEEMYVRNPT